MKLLEIGTFEATFKPIHGNSMGKIVRKPLDGSLKVFLFLIHKTDNIIMESVNEEKDVENIIGGMMSIPKGEITLRDDRIKYTWSVKIQPFLLAKYPVTQALYYKITGECPSEFNGEENPVENVSWRDAVLFCNKLSLKAGLEPCYAVGISGEIGFTLNTNGYRLSSEAEWEYACKAGTTGPRYGEINDIAWYRQNADQKTHKVGMKMLNPWGLHDMLGNVWEWCSDIYDETVYGSYRIFRGGGWCDEQRGCMATNRRRSHPASFKIDDLGFRIARSIQG